MASKKNGLIAELGPNGKPIKETEYVEGKKHGIQTCYDPDGNPAKITTYENNVRVYEETYYKGQIVSKTAYMLGKKEGLCVQYENGIKVSETNYANGKKDGLETIFYPSGAVKERLQYAVGKRGDYESYYENGMPSITVKDGIDTRYCKDNGIPTTSSGTVNGEYEYKEYYITGVLGNYRRGSIEHFYEPNGKEISREEFDAVGLSAYVGWGNWEKPEITHAEYIAKRDAVAKERLQKYNEEKRMFGQAWTKPLIITVHEPDVLPATEPETPALEVVEQPSTEPETPKLGFFGRLLKKLT